MSGVEGTDSQETDIVEKRKERSETDETESPNLLKSANDAEDFVMESIPPTEEPHVRSDSGLGSELHEERSEAMETTANLDESDNDTFFLDRIDLVQNSSGANFEDFDAQKEQNVFVVPCTSLQIEESSKRLYHSSTIRDILDVSQKKVSLKSSLIHKITTQEDQRQPKCKKNGRVSFDSVTEFYFLRAQGFTCVPSQGGSTLGMEAQHSYVRKFSIVGHVNEQHLQLRSERPSNDRSNGNAPSSDENNREEKPNVTVESEEDLQNHHVLKPLSIKQRQTLLKDFGVRIDSFEQDECRDIRASRELCGCRCKEFCDPDTCSCSQTGIKCQVDRLNFPCGCSRDNCRNPSGRIEYNKEQVHSHFIETLNRLKFE